MDISGCSRRARKHAQLLLAHVDQTYPDFRSQLASGRTLQVIEDALGITVHVVESASGSCSVAGSSNAQTRTVTVARAATSRMAFTALHEVAHVEGEHAGEFQQALLDDSSRDRDVEEDACEAFAATLLLPDETVDPILAVHGRTAAGVKALWMAAPQASLEACAVATAQRLVSPGHVLITDGQGRLQFAARSGDEFPLRRGIGQSDSDLRQLFGGGTLWRGRGSLCYAGGSKTETYFLDGLREGDRVIAVAVTDQPDWEVLHIPTPERYEDKLIEGYCDDCGTPFKSSTRCPDCGTARHSDCGGCDCGTRPARGARTCAKCRYELPAHLFSQDPQGRSCNDCR